MNRVIKFRVRDKETKQIIGYEQPDNTGHWEHKNLSYKEPNIWFEGTIDNKNGIIREQFTGLLDKNNIEIYDNDILKVSSESEGISVTNPIYYSDNMSCINLASFDLEYEVWCVTLIDEALECDYTDYEIEVVGNSYEQ
jgi:hypothetical protein